VAIALSIVYFRVTVVVMSLEASSLQTGYFSTSFRVVEILIAVPVLVIGAAFPIVARAARDDSERFEYGTRRMFELSVLVGVWLAMTMVLCAGFVIDVLGGQAAAPAADVLRIQSLAVMCTFVAVASGFALLSLRRYAALLLANGLGLVVTVAVSLALVPVLDAEGAAIATVAAELVLACAATAAIVRARPNLRLPLDILPIALLAGAFGFGIGHLVGVHPLLEAVVGSIVFALALVVVRRFPPEICHAVRGHRITDPA
jgi:PST family polysaccharide transporter